MEPVVYDFSINENGTIADLTESTEALLPEEYYTLLIATIIKKRYSVTYELSAQRTDDPWQCIQIKRKIH